MTQSFDISVSEPDSRRFGMPYVRAKNVTAAEIGQALEFCRRHQAAICVARCATGDFATVHALENAGFRVMDTLLYYRLRLGDAPIPEPRLALPIRMASAADSDAVGRLAAAAFADYFSHYHADPRLDRRKVDEVFVDWARRSCLDKTVADAVFVAVDGSELGAFATMRRNDDAEGEGVLFAVHPRCQQKGVYGDLMISGMHWCLEQGRQRMIVSTQVNNYAVQRAWVRLGFRLYASFYTLHKWF